MREDYKKRQIRRRILSNVGLALAFVLFVGGIVYQQQREMEKENAPHRAQEELLRGMGELNSVMQENIPSEAPAFPYCREVTVSAHAELNDGRPFRDLTDTVQIIIYAEDVFDTLRGPEIYHYLEWEKEEYEPLIGKIYEEKLTKYTETVKAAKKWDKAAAAKGYRPVDYKRELIYQIRTAENTYTWYGDGTYGLNGWKHMKGYDPIHRGPTPTLPGDDWREAHKPEGYYMPHSHSGKTDSAGSSGSSTWHGSTNSTYKDFDYYDTWQYDDPEDFYEDYGDEFDDYEDAEDYWDDYWG